MAFPNFGFSNGRRWRRRRGLSGAVSDQPQDMPDGDFDSDEYQLDEAPGQIDSAPDGADDPWAASEPYVAEATDQPAASETGPTDEDSASGPQWSAELFPGQLGPDADDHESDVEQSAHSAIDSVSPGTESASDPSMASSVPNATVEADASAGMDVLNPGSSWLNVAAGMAPELDFDSLLHPRSRPSSSDEADGSVTDNAESGHTTPALEHNAADVQESPSAGWNFDQNEWQGYLSGDVDGDDEEEDELLESSTTSVDDQPDSIAEPHASESDNDGAATSKSQSETSESESETIVANVQESDVAARSRFYSDDEHMIEGEPDVPETLVYPSSPTGLLDSAMPFDTDDPDPEPSHTSWAVQPEATSSEPFDNTESTSGAVMKDTADMIGSTYELTAAARMERLNPKSANSLTGAPPPKVDGRVEESVLAPETEVLLVVLHAPERNTFRTYLRRHDIPCRAAISAENAVSIVLEMKPAVVLISGSGMNPEEILTLVDDLNDMVDAPILTLLTESQIKLLSNDPLNSHVLQYPASLRHIRSELSRILVEEGNAKPRCSLRSALTPE